MKSFFVPHADEWGLVELQRFNLTHYSNFTYSDTEVCTPVEIDRLYKKLVAVKEEEAEALRRSRGIKDIK